MPISADFCFWLLYNQSTLYRKVRKFVKNLYTPSAILPAAYNRKNFVAQQNQLTGVGILPTPVNYIILQIKHANTQEQKDAISEITIGLNKFFVFAPAKYTLAT